MTRDYADKKKYKKSMRARAGNSSRFSASGKGNKALVINFNPMLILVIVTGVIFITTIFYLEHVKEFINKTQKHFVTAKAQNNAVVKTKKEIISRMPKFEFYHTLPKMEVAVNDSPERKEISKEQNDANRPAQVTIEKLAENSLNKNIPKLTNNQVVPQSESNNIKPDSNTVYTLQLASFKDYKDADELKVKLLLAGFDVYIQTVTLNNGDIWHRVKTNKLANFAEAQDTSAKLRNYNLKSIVVVDRS